MGILKSRKKFFIIAGVLLASVGIFIATKLLWNLDAREFYFMAESKNFKRYSHWINDHYTSFMEKQTPFIDNAFKRRIEVTANVESDGKPFGLKDAGRLFDLVKKSKLVVDTKHQPADSTAISEASLLVEKVPFMDAQLFTKAGVLYFTVPVILPDKYFSLKLDKIDEVYDKFSIPIKPKRFVNATDIAKTVEFDKIALDNSVENLSSVFSSLITKDAVKYGQERELSISGSVVKGKEVLVSLDSESATALLGELAEFISTDNTFLEYTYGNFADLSAMFDDAGLFHLFEFLDETGTIVLNENEKNFVSKINVRKDMEGFRKTLKEALSGYALKDGLNMALVIDKEGNILDRVLTLNLTAPEEDKSFKLDINTGSSSTEFEDCRNRFAKVIVDNTDTHSGKTVELQVRPVFSKTNDTDVKGNIAISYSITAQDGMKSGTDINLDISSQMDDLTLRRNNIVKYRVDMDSEVGDGSIDGEINSITWENKKLNTANSSTKISVQANLPSFGIKDLSAVVNLAGEDRFRIEPFTLPEVQQSAVVDLNAATEKDLDRIGMELIASFGTFYLENKSVFDVILGQ